VREIHHLVDPEDSVALKPRPVASLPAVVGQIAFLDLIFSLDSVLSAVAMAKEVWIMVVATVIAIAVMAIFAGPVARFVHEHPTIKMLALSFLVLIAVLLVADGLGTPIPKGYIYAAMAFSVAVEMLNSRAARKRRHDGAPPSRKAPPLVMPPANTPGRGGVLPEPERAAPSR
jgi:predicted tellurium resistance membrane protein TerC